jgi:hypothetical protein
MLDVISLPESGIPTTPELVCNKHIMYHCGLTMRLQHPRTVELRARRVSRAASMNDVPLRLEDRLRAAQDLLDQELDEMAILRSNVNRFNDNMLQHILVLRNVKNNFVRW